MATELTLDAALRDLESPDPRVRNLAVRNLAQGILDALERPSPSWGAAAAHPQGEAVLEGLRWALANEDQAATRGLALVGLSQLGEAEVLEQARAWLSGSKEITGPGAMAFMRECSIIAIGLLARAAPNHGPEAKRGLAVIDACRETLTDALRSEHDDTRFQAAMSLAEVGGPGVESKIVAALEAETEVEVMRNQVAALNTFDPSSAAALAARRQLIAGPHSESEAGFRAALGLAAARDPEAGPALLRALDRSNRRDRAIEALAALGDAAPAETADALRRFARGWTTPPVTRVRAAYALSRITPSEGRALLARLARSLRPKVRAAVRDAHEALAVLEGDGAKTPSDDAAAP